MMGGMEAERNRIGEEGEMGNEVRGGMEMR